MRRPDQQIVRQLAACRPPRTKQELWWYFKNSFLVVCELCKGAKESVSVGGATTPCHQCSATGAHGFHLARQAVCDGHVAPLDIASRLYFGQDKSVIIIGPRRGGKTRMLALVEHAKMRFQRRRVSHMGAIREQADRVYEWFRQQLRGPAGALPFAVNAETGRPTLPGTPGAVTETVGEPLASNTRFVNGAMMEILAGTEAQASGPSPELAVLDEVDAAKWSVIQQFAKTPTGPEGQLVMASTHHRIAGSVTRIEKEMPAIPKYTYCIWEVIQRCTYPCDAAPLPDGSTGPCPLYAVETRAPDGAQQRELLCGGVKARKADGFIPVRKAIADRLRSDTWSYLVQYCCQRPETAGGGRAYRYGPWNQLDADPLVDPSRPVVLVMDFNVDPLCWSILQEAAGSTAGAPEWHAIDEIELPNAWTGIGCEEFLRRYGAGGSMLPEGAKGRGLHGGLWIIGDRSGFDRTTKSPDTDYVVIRRAFQHFPDFKLLTNPKAPNPPTDQRLATLNAVLLDSFTGRAIFKVAPRCTGLHRELDLVMVLAGTREKDKKSAERSGLSHFGDGLEYWAWEFFPRGDLENLRIAALAQAHGQRAASRMGTPRPAEETGDAERWDEAMAEPAGQRTMPDW